MRDISSNGVLGVQGDPSALPALKNVQSIGFLIHLYCTNFCNGTMVVPMVVPVYRQYGTISKCATLVTPFISCGWHPEKGGFHLWSLDVTTCLTVRMRNRPQCMVTQKG